MTNALICWKCGASLAELPLPLGRLAECLACHEELEQLFGLKGKRDK